MSRKNADDYAAKQRKKDKMMTILSDRIAEKFAKESNTMEKFIDSFEKHPESMTLGAVLEECHESTLLVLYHQELRKFETAFLRDHKNEVDIEMMTNMIVADATAEMLDPSAPQYNTAIIRDLGVSTEFHNL